MPDNPYSNYDAIKELNDEDDGVTLDPELEEELDDLDDLDGMDLDDDDLDDDDDDDDEREEVKPVKTESPAKGKKTPKAEKASKAAKPAKTSKAEKPAKAPKVPKAEKPAPAPKAPKAEKPAPAPKVPKAEKPAPAPKPDRSLPQTDVEFSSEDMKGFKEAAKKWKSLADQTRIAVLMILAEGETYVGSIVECLGLTQPAVSHHLNLLRAADVVDDRREGKHVVYSLTVQGQRFAELIKESM